MNQRVQVHFSGCYNSQIWVSGNCRDLEFVALVELLFSLANVIHNRNTSSIVNHLLLTSRMQWIILNRRLLPQQVLVICPQNPRQNEVQLFLCRLSKIQKHRSRPCLACLLFESVSHILIDLAVKMHVHNGVSFVRHQEPINIFKNQILSQQ